MNTLIGLLIISVGSFGQSSSYVPIKKIKEWSWETFWLVQGVFAWLVFPFLGALLTIGEGGLCGIYAVGKCALFVTVGYGSLWGIGGLTFGLSMRYLGIALGQSLALGTCAAFGTLIPALMKGENLFTGKGLILLIGVGITLAGIAVIGYAGALRSRNMSEEDRKKALKEFALKKGILIALLAGAMSACFSLGLSAGEPIKQKALELGSSDVFALNPVILLVTLGGFLTNLCFCLYQNSRNHTFTDYTSISASVWINNLLFCALAGVLWYSQFFALGMGQSFFTPESVIMAFSWSILMSLNVTFSNVWGILLKEWKGAGKTTVSVLIAGMAILIFSLVFTNLF
ncbi:L-rhamnose/proton symporter RhaT [Porphyromonadaceae bacterium]